MSDIVRAWSTFSVKGFDEASGVLRGIASTPSTDRGGDIMEPLGAKFALPMPFLWQHKSDKPLGWVTKASATKDGIPIEVQIAKDVPVDYIREAWELIKAGLVRGLSIGFKPIEADPIKGSFGLHFKKWEWVELSGVTIPMNSEATIQYVKAMDAETLAKSGHEAPPLVVETQPAAVVSAIPSKGKRNMNTRERISAMEATRAANAAALASILDKTAEEGRTTTDEERQQCEGFKSDNARIDEDLVFWRAREGGEVAKAVPVASSAGVSENHSIKIRSGEMVQRPNKALEPGQAFARYVKAFAFAKGNYQAAAEYAKQWEDSSPEVATALKVAVAAGTTTDSVWAGPLVYAQDFPQGFLEYLRPTTIIGKIPGMRQVPFNIRYAIQDGPSTVGWVGQGAPKPVSKLTFTTGSLGFAKAAGIVVITQELARFSSPSAELVVRNDLAAEMRQFLDEQFIDPGVAAVANVSPASVTNGATAVRQAAAAWTSQANVLTDVKAFLSLFSGQNLSLGNAVWVTTSDVALSLGLIMNTGGTDFAFPTIGVNGGSFFGMPVIVSDSVPHSTSAGSILVLIIPELIYMADEGGIAIDTSSEASLAMDTAPTVPNSATPTAASLVSMWQTNSIAIRVERIINWSRARTYGAGYIDNIHT